MSAHFILDQNFPFYVSSFAWPDDLHLTRLREHAPDLTQEVQDWEILLELSKRGGVDGFITNDADMLLLPNEMVALSRTQLTLVVTDGVGHDAMRATGLVMVYLPEIVKRLAASPQIFVLKPSPLRGSTPHQQLDRIANFRNILPRDLINQDLREIQPRR